MRDVSANVITTVGSFQLTVLAQKRVTRLGYVGQMDNLPPKTNFGPTE
jgi:hypothetical protein